MKDYHCSVYFPLWSFSAPDETNTFSNSPLGNVKVNIKVWHLLSEIHFCSLVQTWSNMTWTQSHTFSFSSYHPVSSCKKLFEVFKPWNTEDDKDTGQSQNMDVQTAVTVWHWTRKFCCLRFSESKSGGLLWREVLLSCLYYSCILIPDVNRISSSCWSCIVLHTPACLKTLYFSFSMNCSRVPFHPVTEKTFRWNPLMSGDSLFTLPDLNITGVITWCNPL